MRVSTEYNQFLVKKDILNSAFLVIFHQFHGKNVHFGYPRFWASVSVISRFYKSGGFGSITVSVPKYRPKTVGSPVSVRTDPALLSIVSTLLLYLYWQKKWQVISIVFHYSLYIDEKSGKSYYYPPTYSTYTVGLASLGQQLTFKSYLKLIKTKWIALI